MIGKILGKEACAGARYGFTLIEVMVSLLSLSVLLMGGAAIVSLSSRAAPDRLTIAGEAADGMAAMDRIEADLSVAYVVSQSGSSLRILRPSLADRSVVETIEYSEFTGTDGKQLIRSATDGVAEVLLDDLFSFSMTLKTAGGNAHHVEIRIVLESGDQNLTRTIACLNDPEVQ